jgi:hypothetical protein
VRALWAGGKGGGRDERESDDLLRLYTLIWNRFVACQMVPGRVRPDDDRRRGGRAELRATGQVIKFPGFLSVYAETVEDAVNEDEAGASLPDLREGDEVKLLETRPEQHFTSRRRVSRRRRWSRSWKRRASGGRRPTRPSCRPSRTAATSRRRKRASTRPSWA